jgi:hypothetical protein
MNQRVSSLLANMESRMKSSDLPRNSVNMLNATNSVQELDLFNRRRTARGQQPVTQEEYNELSYKVMGFGNVAHGEMTVH